MHRSAGSPPIASPEHLWRNRSPSHPRIEPGELTRQRRQRRAHHLADHPQRMVHRLLQIHVREQLARPLSVPRIITSAKSPTPTMNHATAAQANPLFQQPARARAARPGG
jgi:hypothetical protein